MTKKIVKILPEHGGALAAFFAVIAVDKDILANFHPHPLTEEEAQKVANYQGSNQYFIMTDNDCIVAYGMLRYSEGYPDPTFGIAVEPGRKNQGLGSEFLRYLINVAKKSGAPHLTLHVYKNNIPAHQLYRRLGFTLEQSPRHTNELKGILKF